jgi:hypothetical protein
MPRTSSFYYRPLIAVLVWLLILPPVSEMTGGGHWQAAAQTSVQLPPCAVGNYLNPVQRILETTCDGTVSDPYKAALEQLEIDAVTSYLALHGLPLTEASTLYTYGRTDLRSEIRGQIFSLLLGIAKRAPYGNTGNYGNLTPHEITLYRWLSNNAKGLERDLYRKAVDDKNRFLNFPCTWSPDPDIAKTYGLEYYPSTACQKDAYLPPVGPSLGTVPSVGYFVGAAFKASFGQALDFPGGPELANQTAFNAAAAVIGIATAVTLVTALATMTTTIATIDATVGILAVILPHATATFTLSLGAVIGVIALPVMMILVGIMMVINLVNHGEQMKALESLDADLAWVNRAEYAPDLAGWAGYSGGILKLNAVFVPYTVYRVRDFMEPTGLRAYPDFESKTPLPAREPGDPNFGVTPLAGGPTVIQNSWSYVDGAGTLWSARLRGGWFIQHRTGVQNDPGSITTTLRLRLPNGNKGLLSRFGRNFQVADLDALNQGAQTCDADARTGITEGSLAGCGSWIAPTADVVDSAGRAVRLQVSLAPIITSPSSVTFDPSGAAGQTFNVTATNNAAISMTGTLPAGATFTPGNGQATISYTRSGAVVSGSSVVTIQAIDTAGGSAVQSLTVSLVPHLQFLSPNSLTLKIGVSGGLAIQAAGPPYFSVAPRGLGGGRGTVADPYVNLPPGMTFTWYGGGSGLLSGTPLPGARGCVGAVTGCGFVATQGANTVVQLFNLTIVPPPAAQYTGPSSTTFVSGAPNSYKLTATGAQTQVTWTADSLPPWMTMTQSGPGSVTLSGAPSAGLTGSFPLVLRLATYGVDGSATVNFTVNVISAPRFTSPNNHVCTIPFFGTYTSCYFTVTTNQSSPGTTITMNGALPSGESFTDNGNGTASLNGPNVSMGGEYPLEFTASNAAGTTTQSFYLRLRMPPAFITPPSATFRVGTGNVFTIATASSPAQPESGPGAIPNSTGTVIMASGAVPPWLQFSSSNGRATVRGTPAPGAEGTYSFTLRAANQVSPDATQAFTLDVLGPAVTTAERLLVGEPAGTSLQGTSVALSADGNTALAGAPGQSSTGASWVFTRSGGWPATGTKIFGTGDNFLSLQGFVVALSADGNTAVLGGPGKDALWVFTRASGVWSPAGRRGGAGDSVAVATGFALPNFMRIVAGDSGGNRFFEFVPIGGGEYATANNVSPDDAVGAAQFGASIAISPDGNTAIVGGPADNANAGAAWIYTRGDSGWTKSAKLTGAGAVGAAKFGTSVGIASDGATVVVGGPSDNSDAGAMWVFRRSGGVWSPHGGKLTPTGAVGASRFGASVAISGDGQVAMAGGPADNAAIGAVWFFLRGAAGWTQRGGKTVGAGAEGNAEQGTSVALSSNGSVAASGGRLHRIGTGGTWIFGSPDLTISLARTGDFIPGLKGYYTVRVSNAGSEYSLAGAAWNAVLPSNLTPAGIVAPAGWSCSPTGCTADAYLPPGGIADFTLAVNVVASGATITNVSVSGVELNANNNSASDTTTIAKVTPTLVWPKPAAIAYGTALGSQQLNATANVPGAFVYNPPAGTVLSAGAGQTLNVTFTPSDPATYHSAAAQTTIDVQSAAPAGAPAKLVVTHSLARSNGSVVLTVKFANTGGVEARNVTLNSARIGAVSGSPLPRAVGAIAAGGQTSAAVTFPGSVGASRAGAVLSISGTYTGGTFSTSVRTVLP